MNAVETIAKLASMLAETQNQLDMAVQRIKELEDASREPEPATGE